MTEPIRIEGLRELNRGLKALDADLPKAMRVALNQAADVIVGPARARVPKRTGRAANSIRARSTRTSVRVSGGSKRAAYYPWLDFGGRVGRRHGVRRAFLKEGRYLYATYYEKRDSGEFVEILQAAIVGVAREAGFEVT